MDKWSEDLAAARAVQRAFLPATDDCCKWVDIAAGYRPACVIGGDFYDVVELPDGRTTAFLGDVCGHGVSAALLAAHVSQVFRRAAASGLSPGRLLRWVDDWFCDARLTDRFVCASSVELHPARQQWVASNAGQLPILLRRPNGEVLRLAEASGPPLGLGVLQSTNYRETTADAQPGDVVIFITDGVAEPLGRSNAEKGLEVVESILRGLGTADAGTIRHRLLEACAASGTCRDDATVLALQLREQMGGSRRYGSTDVRRVRPAPPRAA